MESEISVLQVEKRIRTRVKRQMEKTQREYYLNEQMKAIQKELGDDEGRDELAELEEKIEKTKLIKEARDKALGELKKLRQMSPMSAEATVVRNYLDWMLGIPWSKRSKIKKDLAAAQDLLDYDHYGLDKVKERIVEYLAVQQRANKLTGPILCLVGPPGVGKTSLGKSIAKATGREFVRMSLGGVRDEAEIRGHRRTYIGSMPGKIIQSMRKAKTSNPLILLDEIDKMGMDFRGDPSAALLEVLDPEQNNAFNDHYLEVDYDLSNVMFVTTANTLNIPPPLLDRMEVIRIAGYTEEEKAEIARKHLIPSAIKKHGLDAEGMVDRRRGAAHAHPALHPRSGRAQPRARARQPDPQGREGDPDLQGQEGRGDGRQPAGLPRPAALPLRRGRDGGQVGVVTGLAWTEVGGELLDDRRRHDARQGQDDRHRQPARRHEGIDFGGGVLCPLAGSSISASSRRCSTASDIHVHVPEGATPKDGPSAGIAMATAIVSVITGIPVRRDIAMTGEVTLRGRVLPIGGLKEKLLAALRGGIKKVLIPEENAKDLVDIPASVKNGLEIVPVSRMDQVLQHALVRDARADRMGRAGGSSRRRLPAAEDDSCGRRSPTRS